MRQKLKNQAQKTLFSCNRIQNAFDFDITQEKIRFVRRIK
jgi:hypothetical protein